MGPPRSARHRQQRGAGPSRCVWHHHGAWWRPDVRGTAADDGAAPLFPGRNKKRDTGVTTGSTPTMLGGGASPVGRRGALCRRVSRRDGSGRVQTRVGNLSSRILAWIGRWDPSSIALFDAFRAVQTPVPAGGQRRAGDGRWRRVRRPAGRHRAHPRARRRAQLFGRPRLAVFRCVGRSRRGPTGGGGGARAPAVGGGGAALGVGWERARRPTGGGASATLPPR